MKKTLTLEECKALIGAILRHGSTKAKLTDHALVVCLLMSGADARTWTWQDAIANPLFQPFAVYEAIKKLAIGKRLTIFPYNHAGFKPAHWLNTTVRLQQAVFTALTPSPSPRGRGEKNKPLTTQEVTRRLKRYGKLAGIAPERLSLRTLVNSHQMYLDVFKDADVFAEALDLLRFGSERGRSPFFKKAQPKKEPRLHGLGRRHAYKIAG